MRAYVCALNDYGLLLYNCSCISARVKLYLRDGTALFVHLRVQLSLCACVCVCVPMCMHMHVCACDAHTSIVIQNMTVTPYQIIQKVQGDSVGAYSTYRNKPCWTNFTSYTMGIC